MTHLIVGTAGHVDHGKTALVKRLTGVDTDRLEEEKERGVSIVLGFAPLRLQNGVTLGIVDVPGHERFIRTMLIGASGMDFVLLIIAANDGIMPQTREHMDILKILGIKNGIVVITKEDLVDDEWMALVQEDIRAFLSETPFKDAPIVTVSSMTGKGVDVLLDLIAKETTKTMPAKGAARARLAIDRSFTITGFGAVVTGTLWNGQIQVGDTLAVFPGETRVRVRGLQVHGQSRETAEAGERVAVNLTGSGKELVERGAWIAAPGLLKDTWRVDAEISLLPSSPLIRQHSRVHLYHGATETLAKINLLDREELAGGESAYAQLTLEEPLCPLPGDRMVLRFYSPLATVGGAVVIDATPKKHKRFDEKVLSDLRQLANGSAADILLKKIENSGRLWTRAEIGEDSLFRDIRLIEAGEGLFLTSSQEETLRTLLQKTLTEYHEKYPLRRGIAKEALFTGAFSALTRKDFTVMLGYWIGRGILDADGISISLSGYKPMPTDNQKRYRDALLSVLKDAVFSPPPMDEVANACGVPPRQLDALMDWMTDDLEIVKLDEGIYISAAALEEAENRIRFVSKDGRFALGDARDALGTSRKFAFYIVDYLQKSNRTVRDGDFHIWLC